MNILYTMVVSMLLHLDSFYFLSGVINDSTLLLSGPKYRGVYLFYVNSKRLQKIGNFNGYNVSFSSDRESILLTGRNKVVIVDLNGKVRTEIQEKGKVGYPIWLDDTRITYPVSGKIEIYNLKDKTYKEINDVNTSWIKWNGKYFVYQENDAIYLMDIHGVKERISKSGEKCYGPRFSPDGKMVLYNSLAKGIYIYNLETKEERVIGKGYSPRWAPCGRYVVFDISYDNGDEMLSSDIYLYDVKTNNTKRITYTPEKEIDPIISEDCKRVYFNTDDGKIGYINISEDLIKGR